MVARAGDSWRQYEMKDIRNFEERTNCIKGDFSRDDWCDLLCNHPQLKDHCPADVWNRFGLGHWARLVAQGGQTFAEKMAALGITDRISDWCCTEHWAEEYSTLFVRCAAASPHADKVRHVAESSAINPNYGKVGGSRHVRYHGDMVKHIQWLASVAADFADMAQNTDASHAEQYALVAEAANYEIQALQGKV